MGVSNNCALEDSFGCKRLPCEETDEDDGGGEDIVCQCIILYTFLSAGSIHHILAHPDLLFVSGADFSYCGEGPAAGWKEHCKLTYSQEVRHTVSTLAIAGAALSRYATKPPSGEIGASVRLLLF
jgi:hypothetical protein